MNATLFLRIASVLSLIHCVLHTAGGVFGSPKHGAEEIAVIENMKSHSFDFMGSMRSYWDFLFGYGLFVTINLLVQAILFWQLSGFAKTNPASTRLIVALFFFNCIGAAIVSWRYFFIAPAVTQLLIAACLGVAFATLNALR
jgi:hypothetical protein